MENEAMLRPARSKSGRAMKARKYLLICFAAVLAAFIALNLMLSKPIESAAEKRITAAAAEMLNSSVMEVMKDYAESGGASFAEQQRTGEGETVLLIDAVGMNYMASRITDAAQKKVNQFANMGLTLPLGSVSGIPMLNGVGPDIFVALEPVGSVTGRFSSKFEDAGVNQTRYCASLGLKAEMEMLLFGKSKCITATVTAPICETIVIGGVPNAYTNVESMDDALNLIPTEANDD